MIASRLGEPPGVQQALVLAFVFVLLGVFEGFVVGWAQTRVLKRRVPALTGWIRATVVGAVVAWTVGMLPNAIMSLAQQADATPTPEIGEFLRLVLAAGLGLVTGPVLAFFQWRVLRHYVQRAGWWLPANGAAWAAGMPIVFAGAHMSAYATNPPVIALGVAATLALAGAVVGAIHGVVLLWLLSAPRPSPSTT